MPVRPTFFLHVQHLVLSSCLGFGGSSCFFSSLPAPPTLGASSSPFSLAAVWSDTVSLTTVADVVGLLFLKHEEHKKLVAAVPKKVVQLMQGLGPSSAGLESVAASVVVAVALLSGFESLLLLESIDKDFNLLMISQ
ncbi:hypothetical protein FGO68_gene10028 [Halteria grandinella]|uniref:Uncharacterized protein n=1 Tax=Halteria grandinella TaxID=5974 RepID=A0A8J8T3K2_HALGN|nr:hypothetical protein FGO68_gene10028 [Halteria grandinella]